MHNNLATHLAQICLALQTLRQLQACLPALAGFVGVRAGQRQADAVGQTNGGCMAEARLGLRN